MPGASRLFVRTALLSFLLGMLGGAALLVYKGATGLEVSPILVVIHTHLLGVGFLVNMVMGVAWWMFPRPTGAPSREGLALAVFWLLNLGLLLRFLTEPFLYEPGGPLFVAGVVLSGLLQGAASILFVVAIWQRILSPRARWEREHRRGPPPPDV